MKISTSEIKTTTIEGLNIFAQVIEKKGSLAEIFVSDDGNFFRDDDPQDGEMGVFIPQKSFEDILEVFNKIKQIIDKNK